MRAFQDPDGPQLIVCATRVAAQGITLTRASNVAFLELEWTPAMHDQAEDRCHRIGQRDAVTAWYLLAAGTIDETMARLIERKRGLVAAVTDGRRLDGDGLVEGSSRAARRPPFPPPARGRRRGLGVGPSAGAAKVLRGPGVSRTPGHVYSPLTRGRRCRS